MASSTSCGWLAWSEHLLALRRSRLVIEQLEEHDMKKIRVLVVDDSVVIRRLLTDILTQDPEIELAGTASNGRLALAKLGHLNPDLVTLDIEMPEMDGDRKSVV